MPLSERDYMKKRPRQSQGLSPERREKVSLTIPAIGLFFATVWMQPFFVILFLSLIVLELVLRWRAR